MKTYIYRIAGFLGVFIFPLSAFTEEAPSINSADDLQKIRSYGPIMSLDDEVIYDFVENGELQGSVTRPGENDVLSTPALIANAPDIPDASSSTIIDNGSPSNRIDVVFLGDGYTSSELDTYSDQVQNMVSELFREPPLNQYQSYFNVYRVDVISNESGIDNDPSLGINKDSALDGKFWCSDIERAICVNYTKAWRYAQNALEGFEQILVLANTDKYGGAARPTLDIAVLNGNLPIIVAHEFGHSFGDLGDEYDSGRDPTYSGREVSYENLSIYPESEMLNQQTKWFHWLGIEDVSTYEGGFYAKYGVYRPTANSKMRSSRSSWGPVNTEQLIAKIYQTVSPIDSATPEGNYERGEKLTVSPVQPLDHDLTIKWWVDGELQTYSGPEFDTSILPDDNREHTVSVRVSDDTPLVRNEVIRDEWMTAERIWTIKDKEIVDKSPIIDNRDIDSVSKSGAWSISSGTAPYGEDSEFSGNSDATFTWNLIVPETNNYKVQAYWTYWGNRSSAAKYTVQSPFGLKSIVLDQKENASNWFTLLEGNLTAGDEITITLSNDANGTLSADATRLLNAEPPIIKQAIIDNSNVDSISKSGDWSISSGADPYGEDSEFSSDNDAAFTWNLVVPETNNYKLQAYWTYWANRTNAAKYTVQSPLGLETIVLDQKDNASTWFTLLEGNFTAGDDITITLSNDANGTLSADAIRLLDIESPSIQVVVDNQDDSVLRSGAWNPSAGVNPFSGQSEYSFNGTFNWEVLLPKTGLYKVEVYWTEYANRTDAAAYAVSHANGVDTIEVNQKIDGGQWVELGQYDFAVGKANILLSNNTGQGTLSADAVRFTLIR